MTTQQIFGKISMENGFKNKEELDACINNFSLNDIFYTVSASRSVEITCPEDLNNFDNKLKENLKFESEEAEDTLNYSDYFESQILEWIEDYGTSDTFDETVIRKACFLGFYPMSFSICGTDFFSVRYHSSKCIITPETFRIPHNIKNLINKKFSDCTISFNRNFDLCLEQLLKAYPDTWLCPKLVEILKQINKNPDENISVNSVEIWKDGKIIAGEIGFITGNTYASLSGFHLVDDIGNVQMAILGKYLFENGFAYWDLGMSILYKYRYGAKDYSREQQEELWNARNIYRLDLTKGSIPLSDFLRKDLASKPETIDTNTILSFPEPNTKYSALGRQICLVTDDIPLQLLYSAYMQGIFPWFNENEGEPVTWYSTDPRFILMPDDFHCPKSLSKFMKKTPYTYTMDKCFNRVITECGKMTRDGQNSTWIGKKMIEAYTKFHKMGYAHSFEVWNGKKLVGGFYGVLIGSVFCGESMFTLEPNTSKSAFAFFMKAFTNCGGKFIDSQSYTDNMARYGAKNISREAFLRMEREALSIPLKKNLSAEFSKITNFSKNNTN